MLELAGRKIPDTLEEIIEPAKTALLVWDMEYAIATNAFNFDEMVSKLRDLITLGRKIGVQICYSQQMHFDLEKEEADVFVRLRTARIAARSGIAPVVVPANKQGHDLIDELAPQPGDFVFQKRRPDGFIGTDFDLLLRTKGIRTVLLGGVSIEGGVSGTARTGRNLGYYMVILKDCVGSKDRDAYEVALQTLEKTFFDIASASEVAKIWAAKKLAQDSKSALR
jgi:nicotinamidase-related amidase